MTVKTKNDHLPILYVVHARNDRLMKLLSLLDNLHAPQLQQHVVDEEEDYLAVVEKGNSVEMFISKSPVKQYS